MKKKLMISAMVVLLSAIYAEAPELQKMLPTEWKYMNKYNGERTEQILEAVKKFRETFTRYGEWEAIYTVTNNYGGVEGVFRYSEIFGKYPEIEIKKEFNIHPVFESYQLYEEKVNGLTFYCYIEHESDKYPTNMYLMYFNGDKYIVYEPVVMTSSCYGTYLIPGKKGKIKAVCMSNNYISDGKGVGCDIIYQTLEKSLLAYRYDVSSIIYDYAIIKTESFLYDKNDPLKYALIKAFDGDLSTSYVEDSEDDLIWLQLSDSYEVSFPKGFSEFKIVNGYAKDKNWYLKNNRPKTIKTGSRGRHYDQEELCSETGASYELLDDTLEWQKCKFFIDQYFLVKDIYKGSIYKDTCIAELDFKYDGDIDRGISPVGWLFSSEPDE